MDTFPAPSLSNTWLAYTVLPLVLLAAFLPACADSGADDVSRRKPEVGPLSRQRVAASMATCAECHAGIVEKYMGHGMAHTLGPLEDPPRGSFTHPVSGDVYSFEQQGERLLMRHKRPDGGTRVQEVLGRYGAGVMDMSFIGSELNRDGEPVGRLNFLPLERLRGHGLDLAPFEIDEPGTGFNMPFAGECLSCHSTQDPAHLPGAARDSESGTVWPGEFLGADAFDHLQPLACDACHGATDRHAELMLASFESRLPATELGLQRLGELPAGQQRDVCAKCHLQGDGQVQLGKTARGGPQPADFLLRRPVLVSAKPGDDFHFVSQVQRLSLSECFQNSSEMTCISCHDPHSSVAAQTTTSFDMRCMTCHSSEAACARPPALSVQDVTGEAARTSSGCVDCHVRRSQPFDLPHVRTADHFVRRSIPLPEVMPMRVMEEIGGSLTVFDDGRFEDLLSSPEGREWVDTLVGLRLASLGFSSRAEALTGSMAPPGSILSTRPELESLLPSLRRAAVIHHLRGLMLEARGDAQGARAAYSDALRVDPSHPQARLNRGSLELDLGNIDAALADADELERRYPRAEKPWNLRALAAARTRQMSAMAAALIQSTWLWPGDPAAWQMLGQAFLELDRPADAATALAEAMRMQPTRPQLSQEFQRARAALPESGAPP